MRKDELPLTESALKMTCDPILQLKLGTKIAMCIINFWVFMESKYPRHLQNVRVKIPEMSLSLTEEAPLIVLPLS